MKSTHANEYLPEPAPNFALAGNNDGPLFLLRSLKGEKKQPLFVALQKTSIPTASSTVSPVYNRRKFL